MVLFAEEVQYFENFNLESIVSPVDADKLEQLLLESKYDPIKTKYLVNGFRNGFSLGYEGPQNIQHKSPNLKFRGVGNKVTLWNKVMKEVKLKRFAGPFKEIPSDTYIQSPIGLVPKDNGVSTHLIFHLSYLRGNHWRISVNAGTP